MDHSQVIRGESFTTTINTELLDQHDIDHDSAHVFKYKRKGDTDYKTVLLDKAKDQWYSLTVDENDVTLSITSINPYEEQSNDNINL